MTEELFSSTTAQLTSSYPELLGTDWADADYFIVWDVSAPAPRVKRLTKLEMFQILVDAVVGTSVFAPIIHSHTSDDISDFVEAAQDAAAAAIVAGNPANNGVTATYDDVANSIVFNVTAGGDTINFVTSSTDFKDSVLVATTANITLSGEQTIDDVLTSASRVLVKDQTVPQENGIWVSAAGAWARADDANEDSEVTPGMLVLAEEGTANGEQIYILSTSGTIVLGTTALTFLPTIIPSGFAVVTNWNTTTKTSAVGDVNRWIKANNASAKTFTLARNSVARIGVNSEFYVQNFSATAVTFVAGAGAAVRAVSGTLTLSSQYQVARVKKIAANEWTVVILGGGSGGASITNSATPPGSPTAGALWFNTETGELNVYYNDGDTSQWVVVSGAKGDDGTDGADGAAGAKWYRTFNPGENEAPTTNYATPDSRNGRPVLEFDTTTQEAAIFSGVLGFDYAGGGLAVTIYCAADTATSGTIGWDVALERTQASTDDTDSDSFASATTITAATVPGTSGQILAMTATLTAGANMDSLAAGELFRLRIRRDVANDTATGDAQVFAVHVREL